MKSLREFLNPILFIFNHPLNRGVRIKSLFKFLSWQLLTTFGNFSLKFNWVGDAVLLIKRGESGLTGNFYVGLMEFEDMSFLLHTLQEDTIFIDVGANMGAYTVLSSKVCGSKTFAFEPVPSSYNRLIDQIYLNKIDNLVTAKNIGLGQKKGFLKFTNNLNAMNRVSFEENESNTILVKVSQLDEEIELDKRVFLKIDVEGYEYDVLMGAKKLLESDSLIGIILELNDCGLTYGHTKNDIHNLLIKYDLMPIRYHPFTREIRPLNGFNHGGGNTIYIKDIERMHELATCSPIRTIHSACGIKL